MAGDGNNSQSVKTAEALGRIDERLRNLEGKINTAHKRIDKLEGMMLGEIKGIRDDLQPLRDWMNRGKGGVAVLVMAGSLLAGLFSTLVTLWAAE